MFFYDDAIKYHHSYVLLYQVKRSELITSDDQFATDLYIIEHNKTEVQIN